MVLAQDVALRASGSSGRRAGILDERRVGGEGGGERVDRPAAPRSRPGRGRPPPRRRPGSRRRRPRPARRGTGSRRRRGPGRSRRCGPKRGIGWGRSAGRHHEPDAGHRASRVAVSIAPIRARATGEGHELDVQGVLEAEVGDVRLPAGDALEAADPRRRRPDALIGHCGASPRPASPTGRRGRRRRARRGARRRDRAPAAASTASMICS